MCFMTEPKSTVEMLLAGAGKGTENAANKTKAVGGLGGLMAGPMIAQLAPMLAPLLEQFNTMSGDLAYLKRLVEYQECRRQYIQADGTAQTYRITILDARSAYVDNTQNSVAVTITVDGLLHFVVAANTGTIIPIPQATELTTDKVCTILVTNLVLQGATL